MTWLIFKFKFSDIFSFAFFTGQNNFLPVCLYFSQFLQCIILNCVKSRHWKVSTSIFVLNLWFQSIKMNSASVQSAFSFCFFFFQREIIICFSFSSCQYCFVSFLLVYPISNLAYMKSCMVLFWTFCLLYMNQNEFSGVFSVVRWSKRRCYIA